MSKHNLQKQMSDVFLSIRDFADHATLRETGVNTHLVGQTIFILFYQL